MSDEQAQPGKSNYVSRKTLQGRLDVEKQRNDALEARLAAIENKEAPAPSPVLQRQLDDALAELARSKPITVSATPRGPMPAFIPYEGWVEATEACHIGGAFREKGDVFQVAMPALWSDDPFVPVCRRISEETHLPVVTPNKEAPARIDFRFRLSGKQDTDIPPLRASQF